jgi:SNF2 family DNA or RNA helicase
VSAARWIEKLGAAAPAQAPAGDGHWRTLGVSEKGHGQLGEAQVGKTWVRKGNRMRVGGDKPFDHQTDFVSAVGELKSGGGIVAAHGTGTGKTYSAVAAFERLKGEGKARRALVLTPAGLRGNFLEKGVHRFTTSKAQVFTSPTSPTDDVDYAIVSYDAFRRNPQAYMDAFKPDTIIADEFHRASNPGSETNRALKLVRPQAKYFMGLTASVAQNKPEDIVPLVQIAAGPQGTPFTSEKGFSRRFVKRKPVEGSKGIFGGKLYEKRLIRREELYNRLGPYIHYVEDVPEANKPRKNVEVVPVQMSSDQTALYRMAMRGVDPTVRIKVEQGLPVSQKEAMGVFTSLMRARQASNSIASVDPRVSTAQSARATPKIHKVLDDVEQHLKATPDGQVIMYTNVVRGGVDVLEAGLKERGIPYGTFTGRGNKGVTEETRQGAVADYLAGKKKVIIITGAGAEGLSLGNTTMVQMVDGHYNPERVNQAEARGIRAGGQESRKPEDREVAVRRYVSTVPKTLWQTVTMGNPDKGVDEWVYSTAARKDRLNKDLRDVLARRSSHEEHKRESPLYRVFGGGP